jgi:NTE family protein
MPDQPPARPSIGLVLGAGGVAGAAYHAGALAALAETTGWDPRTADLVVGTSAGATTTAALRSGLSAEDVFARASGRPLSEAGHALVGQHTGPLSLDEHHLVHPGDHWSSAVTRFLPQAPWLLGPALLRAGPSRWGVALTGLVPPGRTSTGIIGAPVRAMADGRWPEDPTWIVSYRTRDARRVVFGRDDVDIDDLATAVEASSAVPGRFRPMHLESGRYLDGAVYSPTNADVVAGLGFDLVIVSAPMSATAEARRQTVGWAGWPRAWFARLLAREVSAITSRGAAVLVLEPGPTELAAMRAALPDRELAPLVARAAHQAVTDQLAGADDQAGPDLLARASR